MIDRERGDLESDKRRFDVKRYIPSALRTQDKTVQKIKFMKIYSPCLFFLVLSTA